MIQLFEFFMEMWKFQSLKTQTAYTKKVCQVWYCRGHCGTKVKTTRKIIASETSVIHHAQTPTHMA